MFDDIISSGEDLFVSAVVITRVPEATAVFLQNNPVAV
jgi:hypothetical protein